MKTQDKLAPEAAPPKPAADPFATIAARCHFVATAARDRSCDARRFGAGACSLCANATPGWLRTRRSFIRIAATIVAFALLWYASLRAAAATRGAVNVIAKAAFLILTCLACIAIGFFLPMVPVITR